MQVLGDLPHAGLGIIDGKAVSIDEVPTQPLRRLKPMPTSDENVWHVVILGDANEDRAQQPHPLDALDQTIHDCGIDVAVTIRHYDRRYYDLLYFHLDRLCTRMPNALGSSAALTLITPPSRRARASP